MVLRGPEWNHTARRTLALKYVRVSSFERDVPGLFKGTRPKVKEDKIGPSVLAQSFLPWPLVPFHLCAPIPLSSTFSWVRPSLRAYKGSWVLREETLASFSLRPCFPCQNYFSMLSFCEFFLSFEAHSRNSTSAAKALCATESSTWPCDIWGLVFTAFETAFLCRLPSCTVTRTIPWFFLFFCIFFLFFSRLAFHFLAHCLAHWKCLLNFVWWIMNELMA